MIFLPAFRVLLLASVSFASLQIVPGASWTASGSSAHIQAHGGGFIKVDNTFYWIGENKTSGTDFQSITCYSSTDLVQWTFVNNLLSLQSSGDLGPNRIVERPKVIYNSGTSQYVMWMHIDNLSYSEAKTGVAFSSSVCGDYTYQDSFQPLGFQSRDMGLFQDTDGTGYLLSEDRANGLRIDKLSSDYLTVESNTYLFADYEAPALIKQDGLYYIFASHLTGWSPNDNQYSTATSLSGPWSEWADFAPAGTNTFDSQTNYVLQIGDSTFYMGDRWVASDLGASTYVWFPLEISGTNVSIVDSAHWVIDAAHGHWSTAPPAETAPEAESSSNTLTNGAVVISCSDCSGGEAVGYIGGPSGGTLTFNGVTSDATATTTLRIRYANADSTPRYATVTVNGVSHIIAFIPTGSDNIIFDSVLTTPLNEGSNKIEFSAYDGGWAANVDRLMVPVS